MHCGISTTSHGFRTSTQQAGRIGTVRGLPCRRWTQVGLPCVRNRSGVRSGCKAAHALQVRTASAKRSQSRFCDREHEQKMLNNLLDREPSALSVVRVGALT
jgi:hypothetical protein